MAIKKNADGTVDKRTKEGKAVAERMAKARAAKRKKAVTKKATAEATRNITRSVLSKLFEIK